MKKTIITLSLVLGLSFAANTYAHESVSFGISIGGHGDRIYFGITDHHRHYRHNRHYYRHYDVKRKIWYGKRNHRYDRKHHIGHNMNRRDRHYR